MIIFYEHITTIKWLQVTIIMQKIDFKNNTSKNRIQLSYRMEKVF